MENLFMPVQFKASIQLKPSDLDEALESHLLYKLQKEYEGKCSRHGFIKPDSITILQRSMGRLMKPHFNGHIQFNVVVLGEVCNPVEGMVVTATVKNKNVLGVLAESIIRVQNRAIPVLDIIIPKRTAGISSEISLDALNIGDVIQVEILGKRFQLNDQRISIIGRGVESAESVLQKRQKTAAKELLAEELQEGGADDQEEYVPTDDEEEEESVQDFKKFNVDPEEKETEEDDEVEEPEEIEEEFESDDEYCDD